MSQLLKHTQISLTRYPDPILIFLQDVTNGAVYITEATEPGFIKVVLSELKGVARENDRDKRFNRGNDLMAYLKKRFDPSKKYQWYFESIVNLRMKQTETHWVKELIHFRTQCEGCQGEPEPKNHNEVCTAKKLSKRTRITKAPVLNEEPCSDSSSDDEDSDDSDPPVFRKSCSVLQNLNTTLVAKTDNTAPKSAPPRVPGPSPWLAPLQDTYVDV